MPAKASRLVLVRQFVADMIPAVDLWLIASGFAVALLLAWLL